MEPLFFEYMKGREARKSQLAADDPMKKGPVITISREHGCHGSSIGKGLVDAINRKVELTNKGPEAQWRFVSKEILDEAAHELDMSPEMLDKASLADNGGIFNNLTMLFSSGYYASNTKIKNAIAKSIYMFAEGGNTVIVGRAAEAITKDIVRGIRVKLVAPLDLRAEWLCNSKNGEISLDAARKRCIEEDEKRNRFRRYFEGERSDLEYFDMTINMAKMTTDEVVEVIFLLAETRGFF